MTILIGFLFATSITLTMWNLARVANDKQPNWNFTWCSLAFCAAGWLLLLFLLS